MSAYYIISYDVIDQKGYELYASEVAKLLPMYGASVMFSDNQAITIEGTSSQVNAMVIFPSKELALDCYHSAKYEEIKKIRLRSVKNSRFVLAVG
ncbi:hypothetical protein D3C87_188780 [compost metagenome]